MEKIRLQKFFTDNKIMSRRSAERVIEAGNVKVNGVTAKVGDKVEVFSGIFAGYSGILQEIDEEKKEVVILASTERRDIPIFVELKDVRLAQ